MLFVQQRVRGDAGEAKFGREKKDATAGLRSIENTLENFF